MTDKSPAIPPNVFIATKQWIYEICERVARSHAEARSLAFLISMWLEYLALNTFAFSVPLCPQYIQLFALLMLDDAINQSKELRARCPTANLLKLAFTGFNPDDVYKLQMELYTLDLIDTIKLGTALKPLEYALSVLPQTPQIRNVALILMDAFNLQFFSIMVDKPKVACACIAVSRLWISEDEKERWPDDYPGKIGFEFGDMRAEYEQVFSVAYMINKRNLAKRKEKVDTDNGLLQTGGLPDTKTATD